MTADEMTAIIDQLCDKLGLAVDSMAELVPELARVKIAGDIFAIIVCVILIVAESIFMYTQYKAAKNFSETHHGLFTGMMDYVPWNVAWVLAIFIYPLFGFFLIANIQGLIEWCISPTVAAIEYILSLM